jgi:CBS-domain-containing membrane protein
MFKHYGFRAIPLTEENNRIVGVVTYRDVMNLKRVLIVVSLLYGPASARGCGSTRATSGTCARGRR